MCANSLVASYLGERWRETVMFEFQFAFNIAGNISNAITCKHSNLTILHQLLPKAKNYNLKAIVLGYKVIVYVISVSCI